MSETLSESTIDRQSPRWGMIEFLQILSLTAFASAAWLFVGGTGRGIPATFLVILGFVLGGLPFLPYFLDQQLPRRRPAKRTGGLEITRGDLGTLRTLGMPEDLLVGIDDSIVGNWYVSEKHLRTALEIKLGEERIEPWFNLINAYARDSGNPSEQTKDDRDGEEDQH